MTVRVNWQARRAEVAALVEAGGSTRDVAQLLGCGEKSVASGLARLGLRIDQQAARDRRIASLREAEADPAAMERRAIAVKRVANTLKGRSIRAMIAREAREDAERETRRIARQRATYAAMPASERSGRSRRGALTREARRREAARLATMTPGERLLDSVGKRKLPPAPARPMMSGFGL